MLLEDMILFLINRHRVMTVVRDKVDSYVRNGQARPCAYVEATPSFVWLKLPRLPQLRRLEYHLKLRLVCRMLNDYSSSIGI
jgi:hypothetical protein